MARALFKAAEKRGLDVYCLGLCHSSPAALLDHDHVVGMLDEAKLDALLKEAQA